MTIAKLFIALLLVVLNAFFVGAEFSLIKVRKTRIQELVEANSRPARIVQHIHSHLDAYLSATQLGVTLASLALGWVGEETLESLLEPFLGGNKQIAHVLAAAVALTLITYFHVVFGELAPKWLAIQIPDRLALIIALPLHYFYKLFLPLIWFLNATARGILSQVGIRPASEGETTLSEEELRIALSQSEEGGAIPESAGDIADRAFHFGHGKVRDVMTPRPEVAYLLVERSLAENLATVEETNYARYPLCRGSLDDVIGRVHVRDLLPLACATGKESSGAEPDLQSICQPILFVPETKPLDAMLEDFRTQRMEMAIVQDEYGVTAGVVTLEDVLEELVGEIQQEFAPSPSEVQKLPDGSYLVDSKITLARLVREYGVGAEVEDVETVGGYVLSTHTGHPRLGYTTRLDGWNVEVAEMAGRRIRRVRLTPVHGSSDETEAQESEQTTSA